jgi:hypothetical protein
MCQASKLQNAANASVVSVEDMLKGVFANFAGTNQAMMKELVSNLSPIQAAGPSQFGLSPVAEAAERTSTAEQMSAAGGQVSNAVRAGVASEGGGTNFLPSGGEAAILGSLAQSNAVQEALAQSGITQQGYQMGRQNWQFATQGLESAPSAFEGPVIQAGNAALGGGEAQLNSANTITNANRAWESTAGKLVGGALSLIPGVGPMLGAGVAGATAAQAPVPGTTPFYGNDAAALNSFNAANPANATPSS